MEQHLTASPALTEASTTSSYFSELKTVEISGPATSSNKTRLRFWLIFIALCFACLLSALDFVSISTALPNIISDLHSPDYVWVGGAYALSSTAILPLIGSLANIQGRKWTMACSLIAFMLGSAISGAAKYQASMATLIVGRSVAGLGGGAIIAISEIVVADMVPLRGRGMYAGILGGVWVLASAIGPILGGLLAKQWQWMFFLNLPLCGIGLVLVLTLLDLKEPEGTLRERLRQLDIIGNCLLISATTSLTIAIVWGGAVYSWTSYKVLVPLTLGIVGLILALVYEMTSATYPAIPKEVVNNRTSFAGYLGVWLHMAIMTIVVYYFPIYFQAVRGTSAINSAIRMLPLSLVIDPLAFLAGLLVQVTGKYVWSNYIGWAITLLGLGLFTLLDTSASPAMWIMFQFVLGSGLGILYSVSQFAILAGISPSLNAPALAVLAWIRNLGAVIGVALGSSVLNNQLKVKLPLEFVSTLGNSPDLAYSAIPMINDLSPSVKPLVQTAFSKSLRWVWIVCIPIASLGLLSIIAMREIPMHTTVDGTWGVEEKLKTVNPSESTLNIIPQVHYQTA